MLRRLTTATLTALALFVAPLAASAMVTPPAAVAASTDDGCGLGGTKGGGGHGTADDDGCGLGGTKGGGGVR